MISIKNDLLTLNISTEQGFVQWYVHRFMPDHVPDLHQAMDNATLEKMIRNGRNQAISMGFYQPSGQVHFVTLMCKIGANFYDFPGFKEIAQATHLPEEERVEAFYQVSDEQGAAAFEASNDRYWFPDTIRRETP